MSSYRHTQPGYVIIVCMLAACALILALGFLLRTMGPPMPATELVAILAGVALLFGTMTIDIRDGRLRWWFGPGLISKSVYLDEIDHAEFWKMRGIGSWGIHWSPQGWLYNVSGRQGVLFVMKSGKRFILGTDEPEVLIAAIRKAKGSSAKP